MSQLEQIAAGVRAFADEADGPLAAAHQLDAAVRRLNDSASVLAGEERGQIGAALSSASSAARGSIDALESFRAGAVAFADRLVNGGGQGGSAAGGPQSGVGGAGVRDDPRSPSAEISALTLDEIDAALGAINPNFDPFDLDNGYATNCGHTALILYSVLNGGPLREASGGSTLSIAQMGEFIGHPQTPATPDQIEATLRATGAGAHCIVGLDRAKDDGHWFNAYFDGTDLWALDPQVGSRSPWPPDEPDATYWDASY